MSPCRRRHGFHPVVLLHAFLGLVHLRIPLPLFVLGGALSCDQGSIHDRALPHRHAPRAEVGVNCLKSARPARASPPADERTRSWSNLGSGR